MEYYFVRAELQTAHTLGEQLLTLAQQAQDAAMLVAAHRAFRDDVVLPGHSRLSAHTLYAGCSALRSPAAPSFCVPLCAGHWCELP